MGPGRCGGEAPPLDSASVDEGLNFAPLPSCRTVNDEHDAPTTRRPSYPCTPVSDPVATSLEGCVEILVKRFGGSVDGSAVTASLSRSNHLVTHFNNGVVVVDLPWLTLLHEVFQTTLSLEAAVVESLNQGLLDTVDKRGYLHRMRSTLVLCLTAMTDIMKRIYSALGSNPLSIFLDAHSILECMGRRVIEDMASGEGFFPPAVVPSTIEELQMLLLGDVRVWALYTFPYLAFAASSRYPLQAVWNGLSLDKVDVAFHIHRMASRINRQEEELGVGRGVLVRVGWLEEIVMWLTCCGEAPLACSQKSRNSPAPVSEETCLSGVSAPGPLDTWKVLRAVAGEPGRFEVQEDSGEVDVIPEELFDYLWSLFGGGAKFQVVGRFNSRETLKRRLMPQRVSVSVIFGALCEEGRLLREPLLLENVLWRASLLEVVSSATQKLMNDVQSVWEEGVKLLVSMCMEGAKNVCVTHVREKRLEPSVPVQDICKTVRGLLEDLCGEGEVISDTSEPVFTLSIVPGCPPTAPSIGERGICGLMNVGNTCYMNSALQCLLSLEALCRSLLFLRLSDYGNPLITCEFVNLLQSMLPGGGIVRTASMKLAIGRVERRFNTYEQQDAVEFIEMLLDRIHEEMNLVYLKRYRERLDTDKNIPKGILADYFWDDAMINNQSFVPKLFYHQSVDVFVCSTCNGTSTVFDNSSTLVATIAPPTRCVFDVDVLLLDDSLCRVQVKVTCGSNNLVPASDIEKKVWEHLCSTGGIPKAPETATTALLSDGTTSFPAQQRGCGETVLDGCRVVLCADSGAYFPDNVCLLYAAVLLKGEPSCTPRTQQSTDGRYEEQINKEPMMCEEVQEMEEAGKGKAAYLWYFLQPSGFSCAQNMVLCHVECLPGDTEGSKGVLATHIVERSIGICERLLKWKSSDGYQFTLNGPKDNVGGFPQGSLKESVRVRYCASFDDIWCSIIGEETADNSNGANSNDWLPDATRTSRVLILYNECVLQFNELACHPASRLVGYNSLHPDDSVCYSYFGCRREAVDVRECLESTFSTETLTGEDALHCSNCKAFRDGLVERRLFRLPPCLIVSLKRFMLEARGTTKNTAYVKFEERLNLREFLDKESPEQHAEYRLVGVIFHRGALSYGHYTAARFSKVTNRWFLCDDSTVTPREEGPWTWPCARDAYILCYEQQRDDSGSDL